MTVSTHSFLSRLFTEHLLGASTGCVAMNKTDKIPIHRSSVGDAGNNLDKSIPGEGNELVNKKIMQRQGMGSARV